MLLPTKTNPSNKILFRFSFTPFVMGTPNLGVCCILCLSRVSGVQLAMGGSRVQVNKPHKSRFSSKSSRNIHKVSQKQKNRNAKSD